MPASSLACTSLGVLTSISLRGGSGRSSGSQAVMAAAATRSTASAATRRFTRGPRSSRAWPRLTGSVGPAPYAGHHLATVHAPQAGLVAWQTRRPCQIRWWLSMVQSRLGNSAPTSCSAFTGSVWVVQPNRRASRPKWVSTVMPGRPKALPRTTFAVLRPTPGRSTRSLRRGGTSPPCRSTSAALSLSSESVLARKKPSGPMIFSRWSRSAAAIAAASGYAAKRVGRTALTRLSVVWAERTVTTRSSNGLSKSSSDFASG